MTTRTSRLSAALLVATAFSMLTACVGTSEGVVVTWPPPQSPPPPRFGGDISPQEAWGMLASDSWVVLVDVRPEEERAADGQPDLTTLGKEVIFVEWEAFDGTRNPDFIVELEDAGVDQFSTAIFICRSGRRATEAANAAADTMYSHTYNLEGGFSEGWKTAFLPWAVPAIEEGGP